MPDRRAILSLLRRADPVVLMTLVRVAGSSYRQRGARLLLTANGEHAGSLSGGCLEAELQRRAAWRVRAGAVVERYSTLFDDTAEVPFGLGCGGVVDVLLEPADTPEFRALIEAIASSLQGSTRRVLTTLVAGEALQRAVFDEAGKTLFQSEGMAMSHAQTSPPQTPSDSAAALVFAASLVFEEMLYPPQRLVIVGAGNDAVPMARMASALGWRVTVVDGRTQWAQAQRFPEAEVRVMHAAEAVELGLRHHDAVLLMTHSYEQDRAWLQALLPAGLRYLGLLGARHRSALLLGEAASALGWELSRTAAAVTAPMGLDLGGDGAEAIALATIAELQAVVTGRVPRPRSMPVAEVEAQLALGGGSARYLETQCAL
jgi:xanthine dehydrogenase accessory factor